MAITIFLRDHRCAEEFCTLHITMPLLQLRLELINHTLEKRYRIYGYREHKNTVFLAYKICTHYHCLLFKFVIPLHSQ